MEVIEARASRRWKEQLLLLGFLCTLCVFSFPNMAGKRVCAKDKRFWSTTSVACNSIKQPGGLGKGSD